MEYFLPKKRLVFPPDFLFHKTKEFTYECPNGCRHISTKLPFRFTLEGRKYHLGGVPGSGKLQDAWNAAVAYVLYQMILGEYHSRISIVSIDFEAYEKDHSILTELGLHRSTWHCGGHGEDKDDEPSCEHYVFEENVLYRNRIVPDARENFAFGKSKTLPTEVIREILLDAMDDATFVFVFNAPAETKYCATLGIDLTKYAVIDVESLYRFVLGKPSKLENAIKELLSHEDWLSEVPEPAKKPLSARKLKKIRMHNAGNDAVMTAILGGALMLQIDRDALNILSKPKPAPKSKESSSISGIVSPESDSRYVPTFHVGYVEFED